jgi:hypothetical protein
VETIIAALRAEPPATRQGQRAVFGPAAEAYKRAVFKDYNGPAGPKPATMDEFLALSRAVRVFIRALRLPGLGDDASLRLETAVLEGDGNPTAAITEADGRINDVLDALADKGAPAPRKPGPKGLPQKVADFIGKQRAADVPWKDIFKAVRERWPDLRYEEARRLEEAYNRRRRKAANSR